MGASARSWQYGHKPRTPRIVHQTWNGCETDLPAKQAEWRARCMRLNPDWTFWIWTDADNRRLMASHYPDFLSTYDGYDANIKRIDAARIFYLHRFGGIYMDLDFTCLQPFSTALALPLGDAVFSHQYAPQKASTDASAVANNFMASPPGHPFHSFLISQLPFTRSFEVLRATGPNFISRKLREYDDKVSPEFASCDGSIVGPCHVTVYKMPVVYSSGWKDTENPCRSGLPREVDACAAEAERMGRNGSVLATFWTMTWKRRPPPPPPLPPASMH